MKKIVKSDEEWRALLTPEQYAVTRQKGTERPFSGEYCSLKEPGTYACVCCGTELFRSEKKFDSGTGWPSFMAPLRPERVATRADESLSERPRTEVLCAVCEAHLGHVFDDGPPPDGKRYCINSVSISRVPRRRGQRQARRTGEDDHRASGAAAPLKIADERGIWHGGRETIFRRRVYK